MVAARIEELLKPAAKERKRKGGGDKKSSKAKGKSLSPNLGEPIGSDKHVGQASDQAAAALNVSRGTVDNARTCKLFSTPQAQVCNGLATFSKTFLEKLSDYYVTSSGFPRLAMCRTVRDTKKRKPSN